MRGGSAISEGERTNERARPFLRRDPGVARRAAAGRAPRGTRRAPGRVRVLPARAGRDRGGPLGRSPRARARRGPAGGFAGGRTALWIGRRPPRRRPSDPASRWRSPPAARRGPGGDRDPAAAPAEPARRRSRRTSTPTGPAVSRWLSRPATRGTMEAYFAADGVSFRTRVFDLGMMKYRLAGRPRPPSGRPDQRALRLRGESEKTLICEMYEGRLEELPPPAERREHGGFTFLVYRHGGKTAVFWQEGRWPAFSSRTSTPKRSSRSPSPRP